MLNRACFSAAAALALFAANLAAADAASLPGKAAPRFTNATRAMAAPSDTIPPNCTLDPFDHTMHCHLPPNCTLDPFEHVMHCYPIPTKRLD